MVERVK